MNIAQGTNCALTSVTCELPPTLSYSNFLFQEVELFEACCYGLMGQVHYLLTAGVNVNMALFVSEPCIYVLSIMPLIEFIHVQTSLLRSVLLHAIHMYKT